MEPVMTWGIPTHLFLQIHVAISLVALVAGLIALYSWLSGKVSNGWTALFLVMIILTSVTGFPLPPFGLDPPRMVGILSLILLAIAVLGVYVFKISGPGAGSLSSRRPLRFGSTPSSASFRLSPSCHLYMSSRPTARSRL